MSVSPTVSLTNRQCDGTQTGTSGKTLVFGTLHRRCFAAWGRIELRPDQTVGMNLPLASRWENQRGRLVFYGDSGRPTILFDRPFGWGHTGYGLQDRRQRYFLSELGETRLRTVVSTCQPYMERTLPLLLPQLQTQGEENILVVVAAADRPRRETVDGVEYRYVRENAWEYTALLELARDPDLLHNDYLMLLHDTADVGSNYSKRVRRNFWCGTRPDILYAGVKIHPLRRGYQWVHGWCNIGAYRGGFLRRYRDRLLALDGVPKQIGIDIELNRRRQGLNELTANYGTFPEHQTVETGPYEYQGRPRMRRYYPSVDVVKYWFPHEKRKPGEEYKL